MFFLINVDILWNMLDYIRYEGYRGYFDIVYFIW